MTSLALYEAARNSLRAVTQVDEVKNIRDKAQALAEYAKQANDTELIQWATEIKLRAERQMGEMLAETERSRGGRPSKIETRTLGAQVLADVGISRKQSSQFQAVAAVPEDKFEAAIATKTATTASLAREGAKVQEQRAIEVVKAKGTPALNKAVLDEMTVLAKEAAKLAAKPAAAQDAALKNKKARKPKKPVELTVPKKVYEALEAKYAVLQERSIELAEELEGCELVRTNEHVVKIKQLQIDLRDCQRRRDELMEQTVQMRRQIGWLEKELKKRGWVKGEKK